MEMLDSSTNLITHLASGLVGDQNVGLVVNGFKRESSKTTGDVASSSACRPDGRGEKEDDLLL
jgi:hypothetical protein